MKVLDRFLSYVSVMTRSSADGEATPSTTCQFDLGRKLEAELKELGFANVRLTNNCFIYAELPATPDMESEPVLGLIAHMDTADFNAEGIKPQIHPDYDGKDVLLPGSGDVLSPKAFPHLASLKGQTLITTDGTTLLGADDKAGIAEIISGCEKVVAEGRPHGKVVIAFTPDEEIGRGVHSFDVPGFGADFAYTLDGGEVGELAYENFNACEATVEFSGFSVHPGSSKDTMINASLLAMEFNSLLPSAETPRDTEEYEGFFHLCGIEGDVSSAKMLYIVRDHSAERFEGRKEQLRHIEKIMNHRWGEGAVKLTIREEYRNMREKIEPCFFLIENARKAMEAAGMKPFDSPIRGGTDGAQLCYMGLPCPNLCTGGHAFHGQYEHITAEALEQCTAMVAELICGPRK